MNLSSQNIDSLRKMIDEKDTQIHKILVERAKLVTKIGDAKRALSDGENVISFRPAREAKILRSLLAQDSGDLPKSVLISIWREMISSFCALQSDFSVAYWGDFEPDNMRDMVRYYFGHTISVKRCQNVTAVLQHLSEDKTTIGIVPAPNLSVGVEANWWLNLSSNTYISGVLPFVKNDPANKLQGNYYFLSKVYAEETGDDIFMLHVNTIPEVSRMSLVSYLNILGYAAQSLAISDDLNSSTRQHLIEVKGYISDDKSESFQRAFSDAADGKILASHIIGQYPAPYEL